MTRLAGVCTAICGPPSRQRANRHLPAWPLHYHIWPVCGPPT